jgi:hypothetical protein
MSNAKKSRRPSAAHTKSLQDKSVLRRLDLLDEKIWLAARATDDPHLAVRAARDFADDVFLGVLVGAGSGQHRLNCSVTTHSETLTAPEYLPLSILADVGAIAMPRDRGEHEICELIALAHASASQAVIVLRTSELTGPPVELSDDVRVRGWRITEQRCEPLDAAGMFAVSCSESIAGEVLPLNPGTHYEDGYPLMRIPRSRHGDEGDLVLA